MSCVTAPLQHDLPPAELRAATRTFPSYAAQRLVYQLILPPSAALSRHLSSAVQSLNHLCPAVQSLNDKIPGEAKRRERAVAEVVAMLRKCLQTWVSGSVET